MFTPAPRVQVPSAAAKGEVFPVKTLISHQMETGLRRDDQGNVIPRKIINKFTCRYNDVVVFSVDLHEAVILPARDGERPTRVRLGRGWRRHLRIGAPPHCRLTMSY